jgi:hypothetical protein
MTRLIVLAAAALLAACASSPAPNAGSAAAPAAPAADPRCAYLAEIAARMDGQVPPPPATAAPASAPVVTGRASARACPR